MNIVAFLVVGLIAGWIAGKIVEGHGFGVLGDIVVGIIGAFVGGFLFSSMVVGDYGFWGSVAVSAVGSIVFLFFVGIFSRSRWSHGPLTK